jgi:AraC-like DNA-binding protein
METYKNDVSQVAEASGFSSPGYFSTCFRKHFGLSPSDFRDARRLQPDNLDEIGDF